MTNITTMSAISPDMMAKLMALKPVLERNGIVQRHAGPGRRPGFRLRYRVFDPELNRVVHKSVTVRPAELEAAAIAGLLAGWQAEYRQKTEKERAATAAQMAAAKDRKRLRRAVLRAAGGTWRHKQHVAKEFDEAMAKNPCCVTAFFQHLLIPETTSQGDTLPVASPQT